MKITGIETYKCWAKWMNWLFVRITTDEPGLHGWGEASFHGGTEAVEHAIHEMGATLIGLDPAGVEAHWYRLYHGWRWRGGSVLMTALSGLDGALWDIEGKRLGVPVYRLLGGPFRDRLPTYASHWCPGVKTTDEAAWWGKEAVRLGYKGFKWSPIRGAQLRDNEAAAIRHGVALMAAAREAAGPDMEIAIECGEAYTHRTAVLVGRALAPYRPLWMEEPLGFENARAFNQLKQECPVPIATGERLLSRWEFRELIDDGAVDVYQPDLVHAGGITECRKIASQADTYFRPIAPHNPYGPVAWMMSMHLAASIPNFLILEDIHHDTDVRNELIVTPPIERIDGCVLVPDRPGLGVELNIDAIKARPYRLQPAQGLPAQPWH